MPRKRKIDQSETYWIEVDDVEYYYSLHLHHDSESMQPYMEYCHPKVFGKLLQPSIKQISRAIITLMGDRDMDTLLLPDAKSRYKPRAIGHMETRSGELSGFVSLPFSALIFLLPALKSGSIREIMMSGDKLRYRHALVKSVSFSRHFDPDEI